MRALDMNEALQVSGGQTANQALAADAILTASVALLGFCLSGGNPAGAMVGAEVGHAIAMMII